MRVWRYGSLDIIFGQSAHFVFLSFSVCRLPLNNLTNIPADARSQILTCSKVNFKHS